MATGREHPLPFPRETYGAFVTPLGGQSVFQAFRVLEDFVDLLPHRFRVRENGFQLVA